MAAIVPEFEYDIFISYRQNDNKYDNWVSEFVHNLTLELVATLKDKLSIYFDENPHDGIRDTHNVDKSLSAKLNSLIFIPIISNTYCDTTSFAWQHEFLPFKTIASQSNLGMDITLPSGNVASRILPIRIHEMETDDVRLLEKELSGVLRSIDFIYKSSGVNRPLRPKDDNLADNQNGTIYRNQINKAANAIKEVVFGIKKARTGFTVGLPSFTAALKDLSTSAISATVPENIRYAVIKEATGPTVYLAWTSFELKAKREEMMIILQKAGFNVVPTIDCPSDEHSFRERTHDILSKAKCSLHILGNEFGRRFEENEDISFPRFQFDEAKMRSEGSGDDFQTFVWFAPESNSQEMKSAQASFINYIRNNITRNMIFSNSMGPMQLVDDMRAMMMKKEVAILDTKDTDIFFIFNQQDEIDAQNITDLIGHEYPIEIMNIMPDGEDAYRELSKQQIPRSRLAVIYFKYAADWALPFIKQMWKQVGGASSPTTIMLVGEDDPKTNIARIFKAPKVVSSIVSKAEVPGEVKRVYVKVVEP